MGNGRQPIILGDHARRMNDGRILIWSVPAMSTMFWLLEEVREDYLQRLGLNNWRLNNLKAGLYSKLCLTAVLEIRVCLIEKAGELGAHTLSGAVIETSALAKLFPGWEGNCPPVHQKVTVGSCAASYPSYFRANLLHYWPRRVEFRFLSFQAFRSTITAIT